MNDLTEVYLPDSVEVIETQAFSGDENITKFEYKGKLKYLGSWIFIGTYIKVSDFISKDQIF